MEATPSRPIKVMHIIARMNVGGPAVEITELMRGLDPNIISQRLVTGYCNDDEADFLETQAPDVSATRIHGLGRSIKPTDDAKAFATLVRIIRASRPDIVHTHTAKAGVLGRIAAKASGTGTRIIHTYHGHLLNGYFGPMKTKAVVQFERRLARITDHIIAVGARVRDDLLQAKIGVAGQFSVIRSGVKLGPLPDKPTARRELALPDGPLIVTMIGRVTRIKRPDRFADVVKTVSDRGLDIQFLVVGGGDQEEMLRKRIEQDDLPIKLLGWRSDLERILSATDIVVMTSDNEGMPLVLLQAGLAGIPVVAPDVGSISELVSHCNTGLVTARDDRSIAEALIRLNTEPRFRMALGRNAQELASELNDVGRFVAQHETTYSLVSGVR